MSKQRIIILILLAAGAIVGWELLRDRYADDEKALRSAMREQALAYIPQVEQGLVQRYGLRPYVEGEEPDLGKPQVILIHGLDDPGKVWMNLAPMLQAKGFVVWLLRYPDDQPIQDSADLFHAELQRLKQRGVARLSIVAHSMGGLVSRDLLTRPQYRQDAGLPRVEKLVMVGTPNQGSELARFRLFAEFRDQFAEWLSGNGSHFGWLLDGAGEAGIDLTPGSAFLLELNQRPLPAKTELLVIAGVLAEPDMNALLDRLSAAIQSHTLEDRIKGSAQALSRFQDELLSRIGDGLVSVDSARLTGAGFHQVQGNHLSIIRNVSADSTRMPPAIPIILAALEAALPADREAAAAISQ